MNIMNMETNNMNIRERFEEIWPVPEGVIWAGGEYMPEDDLRMPDQKYFELAAEHDARLDTFTRCQETTAIHLGLIDELVQSLQWYVDEDEINEGQEGNEYWLDGKHEAEALLGRAKQIMEQKK